MRLLLALFEIVVFEAGCLSAPETPQEEEASEALEIDVPPEVPDTEEQKRSMADGDISRTSSSACYASVPFGQMSAQMAINLIKNQYPCRELTWHEMASVGGLDQGGPPCSII